MRFCRSFVSILRKRRSYIWKTWIVGYHNMIETTLPWLKVAAEIRPGSAYIILKNPTRPRKNEMNTYPFNKLLIALCSVLLLISCGGSGGPSAGGGIGGTGIISSGTVSAHGSIYVNGLEFDTSDAVIIVNGEEVGTGDQIARDYLDIGKVVLVEGTGDMDDDTVVANRVTHTDNVAGPVESIFDSSATRKEIVVLGQNVILNVLTKFKKTAFDTIALERPGGSQRPGG